ncbi:hypothetical protein [Microbacterium sp.]|uniref:hypothetical protein n=1 Tax=Microbacterium sp. TaxID=51671 RepID=UPI003F96D6DD
MAKQKQKRAQPRVTKETKPYRAGIVVVHVVGNQKQGATIEHVAERIDVTLSQIGLYAESADVPAQLRDASTTHADEHSDRTGGPNLRASASEPGAKQIVLGGPRAVLIAEAHWSDIVRDHREKGWRPAISRVRFIAAVLPYLLSAALAPRTHEMKKLAARSTPERSLKRSMLDSEIDEIVDPGEEKNS